jgi:DNA-binding GntR family transcriptional regulator
MSRNVTTTRLTKLELRLRERQESSIPQLIVDELEEMIIAGTLRGGDRINESALANRLGVSRGPVREACRQLERARLLEFRTNRGMFVREITIEEAAQLYDIRAHLFGLSGRLGARSITRVHLDELRALVKRLEDATELDDYYPLNVELHHELVSLSGYPRLAELYDSVSKELHLFRRSGLIPASARHASNQQHRQIIDGLEVGDVDEVERLMVEHILAGKQRMLADHGAD